MLEGHQGSCLCGKCLSIAYTEVILNEHSSAPAEYQCPMCLEKTEDREALGRADEPGWQSPVQEEAVICKRCVELAAKSLEKDKDFGWTRPGGRGG